MKAAGSTQSVLHNSGGAARNKVKQRDLKHAYATSLLSGKFP